MESKYIGLFNFEKQDGVLHITSDIMYNELEIGIDEYKLISACIVYMETIDGKRYVFETDGTTCADYLAYNEEGDECPYTEGLTYLSLKVLDNEKPSRFIFDITPNIKADDNNGDKDAEN